MTKRIISLVMAIILVVPMGIQVFAGANKVKVPDFAKKNTPIKSITVEVPNIPGLEITFTNIPKFVVTRGNDSDGNYRWVEFYVDKDTTFSFNKEVKMQNLKTMKAVKFTAGKEIKASEYQTSIAYMLATTFIVSEDGSFKTNTGSSSISKSKTYVFLSFLDNKFYGEPVAEGSVFTDLKKWKAKEK